jgi:putative membrane protein
MPKVIPITGAVVAAILAATPGAVAQDTSYSNSPWRIMVPKPGTGTLADTVYIRQAMRGNLAEVAFGRLAESRASNSEVKGFAKRMIADHDSMAGQWSKLARNDRMTLDLKLDPEAQQSADRLRGLSGAAFDQAYIGESIRDHEQALSDFQRMGTSARSPEVRQLAAGGVPVIQEHLALARQVGSRVGVATTAGRVGGVTPVPAPTPAPVPSNEDRRRADTERTVRGPLRAEDRAFVNELLGDHLLQIRLARRAQREAKRGETTASTRLPSWSAETGTRSTGWTEPRRETTIASMRRS